LAKRTHAGDTLCCYRIVRRGLKKHTKPKNMLWNENEEDCGIKNFYLGPNAMVHIVIPATQEVEMGRISIQANSGKNERPYVKNNDNNNNKI
jgi:hypothetical protein